MTGEGYLAFQVGLDSILVPEKVSLKGPLRPLP